MDKTQAIWIKDPLAILADGAARGIVVRNGKIVELVPKGGQPTTPARFFEAGDHVVLPGLINTHHHFYQTLTRALPAALDRELFPWLQALYPVWARLTPESLNLGVTVAMSELLLSGCTTTTDHHYVFPAGLEDAVDIEVAVARRLGIRVLLTRGSMNRSQRDGGLPPDSVVQDEDTILADSERVVTKHHQRGENAMVQIALAPCSPFSVTTSLMNATAALAERLDVRLHTHLAETEDENQFCQQMHGCRPLDYLEQCGWLNARTWLAHGIHFNPEEIKRLGRARTSISHCACSNQLLASGCCPVRQSRRSGAVQARRIALLRPRRPTGGAGSVRGASRRQGDGRGKLGSVGWRNSRSGHARSDPAPQRRRAYDAGGMSFSSARMFPRNAAGSLPPCGRGREHFSARRSLRASSASVTSRESCRRCP